MTLIAWSPDATYLASGDASGRLLVWSLRSGCVVRSMQVRRGAGAGSRRARVARLQGTLQLAAARLSHLHPPQCLPGGIHVSGMPLPLLPAPDPASLFVPCRSFFPQAPSTVYDLRFNKDSSLLACCTGETQPILVADLRRQA